MAEIKNTSPLLAGSICLAKDCKYVWNAFFPQGSDDPSGFVECPKCRRMTAQLMPDLWYPKNGGFRDDGGIDVA